MGRLLNGINGPFIGKAGSVIGYTMKGQAYIKGHYKNRTKKITEKEILNREKFTVAQKWLAPLLALVRVGFKGYNVKYEGFGAAKSYLMKNALHVDANGSVIIDPSLVKISHGDLPVSKDLSCVAESPDRIRFSWDPKDQPRHSDDQVMVLVYCPESEQAYGKVYGCQRDEGEFVTNIHAISGRTYHTYLAFIAADRSRQSDSVYLGSFGF